MKASEPLFSINVYQRSDETFEVFEERTVVDFDGKEKRYSAKLGQVEQGSGFFHAEHPDHGKFQWQSMSRALAYLIAPRAMT